MKSLVLFLFVLILQLLTGRLPQAQPLFQPDLCAPLLSQLPTDAPAPLKLELSQLRTKTLQGQAFKRSEILDLIHSIDWHKGTADRSVQEIMEDESEREKSIIRKALAHKKAMIKYDLVIVGGGIHAAILNTSLRDLAPQMKILTVEASDQFAGTFRKMSNFFRINSPEDSKTNTSTNVFPSAALQLADISSNKYPVASDLGLTALFAQFGSYSKTILQSRVTEVFAKKLHGPYRITTNDGLKFSARMLVFATGLGQANGIERSSDKDSQALHGVQTLEEFVQEMNTYRKSGGSPLEKLANERIAVVGAGDAGNVAIEFLYGRAPRSFYRTNPYEADLRRVNGKPAWLSDQQMLSKIFWFGQKASSPTDFMAFNKRRYDESAHLLSYRNLITLPYYVHSLEPITEVIRGSWRMRLRGVPPTTKTRYRVNYFLESKLESVVVDRVIMATGYTSTIQNIFADLSSTQGSDIYVEPLYRIGHEGVSMIGRRLVANKDKELSYLDILLIGTAAGNLATKAELSQSNTMNAASIDVLAPRTHEVAKIIAELFQ